MPTQRPARSCPPYRHDRLRESFEPLMMLLDAELSWVRRAERAFVSRSSRAARASAWPTVADRALFSSAMFVLAAKADVPAEDFRAPVSGSAQGRPVEKIRDLVMLALAGVPVTPMPVAPRQIPFHAGCAYFELDQTTRALAAAADFGRAWRCTPASFPALSMEFWAIRSGGDHVRRFGNDDPFGPKDATIIRPRPGGVGRPRPILRARWRRPSWHRAPDPVPAPCRTMLGQGLNPLVQAATNSAAARGAAASDARALATWRAAPPGARRDPPLRGTGRAAGAPQEVVLAARYALCATLDEAVLSTPWGAHSEWAQQSLLVALHREAWGGAEVLRHAGRVSRRSVAATSICWSSSTCAWRLALRGKYHVAERGPGALDRDPAVALPKDARLSRRIAAGPVPAVEGPRGSPQPDTEIRAVVGRRAGRGRRPVADLLVLYTRLGTAAAPVQAALAAIGTEVVARACGRAAGPDAPATAAAGRGATGTLAIEEDGGRTTVTLLGAGSLRIGERPRRSGATRTR